MKRLLLLMLFMSLVSCKESVVDKINKDFDDNQWMRSDIKTYEFEIKRDIPSADILLNFSHVFDPGYSRVPVVVNIQNVTDNTPPQSFALNLILKDEEGESLSDCSGDICDFSYTLSEGQPMKKGNYKVTVQNQYQWEYLPNTLAVGVSVKKDK
jgi:gliding motility-associated lipoprotein GldH